MLSEQQKSDFEWFKNTMPDLYHKFGRCTAVIRNKAVAATFPTFDEAADWALANFEPRTFIVQEIGNDPSVYSMQLASLWVTA